MEQLAFLAAPGWDRAWLNGILAEPIQKCTSGILACCVCVVFGCEALSAVSRTWRVFSSSAAGLVYQPTCDLSLQNRPESKRS